jgi:hypothetical protein
MTMTTTLEDLAPWSERRPGLEPAPGRHPIRPFSRRSFLKAVAASGIGLGMMAIGKMPLAAAANPPSYCAGENQNHRTIKSTCYTNYDDVEHCYPSTVYFDTCSGGWHKSSGNYRNRPDQCNAGYDGWKWLAQPGPGCSGGCDNRYVRCHDGCKKLASGSWVKSICRANLGSCFC